MGKFSGTSFDPAFCATHFLANKRSASVPKQLHSAIGPFPAYSYETFFTKKIYGVALNDTRYRKSMRKLVNSGYCFSRSLIVY